MRISFLESNHYDFVLQFVNRASAPLLGLKSYPHTLEIEAQNPIIGRLIQRISQQRSAIFPYASGAHHSWLVTAPDRYQLEKTLTRISRFLTPTYAVFGSEDAQPQFRFFDDQQNKLQQLGASIYPAGYYSLRAPASHFNIILQKLDLWMDLEEEQPDISRTTLPTYHSLHDHFEAAVSATNWQEAEHVLYELQRLHLITAENMTFLQVRLFAQQQRWHDIWLHPNFTYLTHIRIPMKVRAALLIAFYAEILLPFEQEGEDRLDKAVAALQQYRSHLGLLLTGRFGMIQTPIIHVFAYQAIIDQDDDALHALASETSDEQTIAWLHRLLQLMFPEQSALLPAPEKGTPPTTLQRAKYALIEQNYDEALRFTRQLETAIDKSILLMQIAFYSSDVALAEEALLTYWEFTEDEQTQLEHQYPFLRLYLNYLDDLTRLDMPKEGNTGTSSEAKRIDSWSEWFDVVESEKDKAVADLPNHLLANQDINSWPPTTIAQLADKLMNFLFDDVYPLHLQCVVLQHFVNCSLQDDEFPREEEIYVEMYNVLYEGIHTRLDINQTNGFAILRLAEILLRHAPQRGEKIFNDLYQWCTKPIAALESWALDVFDLLAEYGVTSGLLLSWYRDWVSILLELPNSRERVHLDSWYKFGIWMRPGQDFLQRLEQARKAVQEETNDAIKSLPSGYQISIMTLRTSSAQRVREMLLERNEKLNVRICTEHDLNEQTKAIVQHANMVVIVTTCITHALTYGIRPYMKGEPVYPSSSGSSSIMKAIEQRAQQITS